MFFRQVYDDSLAQAAYLIGCQRTGEAIVIDAARDVDRYLELARANGLRIVAATETHIHADFLSGSRELAERTGARLYLSDEGTDDWKYGWLDQRSDGKAYDHVLVKNGDSFRVGNIEFRVAHTPGHTPEHVSFLVTDVGGGANRPMGVLSGDFVFVGDLGRPDLLETAAGMKGVKEDSARALFDSARHFLDLDDYLQVWPAHGAGSACGKALGAVPQSTVGYERQFNPALRIPDEPRFVDFILEGQPEPPLYFARMKRLNRDGVPVLGPLPEPRELSADEISTPEMRAAIMIDTRPWDEFRAGHVEDALFAQLGATFHAVAGSYVEPEDAILLVTDRARIGAAVRELVRIGLDRIVGFITPESLVASGFATAVVEEISVDTLGAMLEADTPTLLDVRRATELTDGSISESALHVPHTRLPRHLSEIPRGRPVLVHCATGRRSAFAAAYLRRNGVDAINVGGGFQAWKKRAARAAGPVAAVENN
jgi:hydroxyacylglutathione hydrolase